jgi:DNA-binding NtrC family response regulator
MRELFTLLERVAASDAPVLIEGETGTGKELCAHAIHAASVRKRKPLTICDLAAAAPSLIESELFGHVHGAFTGADRDRDGAFFCADGGSLFLDEIGELDAALQPRLLRALERSEFKPLGGEMVRVDARVIAATNRNLAAEVQAGRFRSDLYYRLTVLRVALPPLRVRREDIPLLVERFLGQDAPGASVDVEAMALLVDYDWPGNVRELRNVVRRATSLLAGERVIEPRHLGIEGPVSGPERFHEAKQALVSAWETEYLKQLLARSGGNMSRAARVAGLERAYLYRLVRKHGLRGSEGDET